MRIGEYLLLIGPNRRTERTIIEQQIILTDEELTTLPSRVPSLFRRMVSSLNALGVQTTDCLGKDSVVTDNLLRSLACLFTGTALALQKSAGHRVSEQGCVLDDAGQGVWAWFEYEHDEVGARASVLSLSLLAELEPAVQCHTDDSEISGNFARDFEQFLDFARPLVLPLDAEAIVIAARDMDVPCVKLERIPYAGVQGDFRIRPNGLLMLGHCGYQCVVDGTISITRNADLLPLLRDREALRKKLSQIQVPMPRRDDSAGNCILTRRAVRAADRIGYPVVVKPGSRERGKGITLDVRSAQEVPDAVERARLASNRVIIEAMVQGVTVHVLVANHEVLGVIAAGAELPPGYLHESLRSLAIRTSLHMKSGLLAVSIVTTDPGRPFSETGGAVVDVDLAPELDILLPPDSPLLIQAARAFVRWLYPGGSVSRIPVVAVTGTNGKTTTCRMIARIMQMAGRHTGMVCSGGIYVNERFEATMDDIGHGVDHRIFEYPNVDFAVLEEYFGRIARQGFSFSSCDVAVCTNVSNDHLGRIGIHTLEQMAELKSAVPLRARDGVVLNADDRHCAEMAKIVSPRTICLISCQQNLQELAARLHNPGCYCVLEDEDGKDWIVIYDREIRKPVIAVDDVPATFFGSAMHNTSNAMHAAAACYLSGAGIQEISKGLSSFSSGFESNPGRLNIFDGLPFRVVMDYAHNADGFRKLCAFVDRQHVSGRKIVMMAIPGDRRDADIAAAAAVMAGHFDHYVCRNDTRTRGRSKQEVPGLMKAGLQHAGVPDHAISVMTDAAAAIRFSLRMASEGDLLVLLPGNDEIASTWAQIENFTSGHA